MHITTAELKKLQTLITMHNYFMITDVEEKLLKLGYNSDTVNDFMSVLAECAYQDTDYLKRLIFTNADVQEG